MFPFLKKTEFKKMFVVQNLFENSKNDPGFQKLLTNFKTLQEFLINDLVFQNLLKNSKMFRN